MKKRSNSWADRCRGVLQGLSLVLAVALLGGCSATGPSGEGRTLAERPVCWALLADTHIDPAPRAAEREQTMAENLERVVQDVLAHPRGVEQVIIVGDVAHAKGQLGAYEVTRRLLEPVLQADVGLHVALGNHDNRENLFKVFPEQQRRSPEVPNRHVECFRSGPVKVMVLDSLIRPNHNPGEIGPDQLRWLAGRLDADPVTPTLVFLHHDVRESGASLQDADRLLEVLTSRHQVKAVFHGHSHVYVFREIDGVHVVELPATAYRFADDQPLGWVHATFRRDGAELRLRELQGDQFVEGEPRRLRWR